MPQSPTPLTRHPSGARQLSRAGHAAIVYVLMVAVVALFVGPFLWMLSTSLKTEPEIFANPYQVIPPHPSLTAYQRVVESFNIVDWFYNSSVVAIITTVVTVAVDAMAGFALARLRFRLRRPMQMLIFMTFLIPLTVLIAPLYLGLARVRLLDSYFALIVPVAAGSFGVFLMMTFFSRLPVELEEAARIDGAGWIRIFFQIALPLSRSALAAVGLLTFIASWNNFFWPLVASSTDFTRTIPVGIATLVGGTGGTTMFSGLMASAVMSTLPTIVIFAIFQRYFVQGIATTGIKG